jgi:hypothetical protein
MPFRLDENRAKIQFVTGAWMPSLIAKAREHTGITSQTRYVQLAVCAQLAKDLALDYDKLVADLPEYRNAIARDWWKESRET